MILHLSGDLMLVGKVSAWANAHQIRYTNAATLEKFRQLLATGEPQRVIIDLQFRGLDIAGVAAEVRSANPDWFLAGYAQHVMTDLLDAAGQAGFDAVLTRGQFDRQFAGLLTG